MSRSQADRTAEELWGHQGEWGEISVCQGERDPGWGEQCTAGGLTSHGKSLLWPCSCDWTSHVSFVSTVT